MTKPHRSPSPLLLLALAAGAFACDSNEDADPRTAADRPPAAIRAPADDEGCTYTQGYWKNHDEWPMPNTVVCDQTWLEILHTPPKGDPWYILAHQWIAASLNVGSGAAPPADDALIQAEVLLSDCVIDDGEHDAALALAGLLDDYNNGELGPGHCGDGGDDDGDDDDGGDDDHGDDDCGDESETGDDGGSTGDDGGSSTGDLPIPG